MLKGNTLKQPQCHICVIGIHLHKLSITAIMKRVTSHSGKIDSNAVFSNAQWKICKKLRIEIYQKNSHTCILGRKAIEKKKGSNRTVKPASHRYTVWPSLS